MNSCDVEPPIMPTSAPTTMKLRPSRPKILSYASRCSSYGDLKPRLVERRGCRVLHRELADADQAGPGARLVAPLGLEVVDDLRSWR